MGTSRIAALELESVFNAGVDGVAGGLGSVSAAQQDSRLSAPLDMLRVVSLDRTKTCKYCNGPVRYTDSAVDSWGAPEAPRVDRSFYCADGCATSRLTDECGHDQQQVR